jgi:hypothetical protein
MAIRVQGCEMLVTPTLQRSISPYPTAGLAMPLLYVIHLSVKRWILYPGPCDAAIYGTFLRVVFHPTLNGARNFGTYRSTKGHSLNTTETHVRVAHNFFLKLCTPPKKKRNKADSIGEGGCQKITFTKHCVRQG